MTEKSKEKISINKARRFLFNILRINFLHVENRSRTHSHPHVPLMRLWLDREEGKQTIRIKKELFAFRNLIHHPRLISSHLPPEIYHFTTLRRVPCVSVCSKVQEWHKKFITLLIILRGFESFLSKTELLWGWVDGRLL